MRKVDSSNRIESEYNPVLVLMNSTALGPRHIGSIVICLPSKFQGGALVVEKDGVEMTFDFASSIAKLSKSPKAVSWAFLYADCKHEVLPVESGVRVTLAYDVYVQKPEAIPNRGDDPVTTVCGPLLKRLLLDRQKKWFSQQPFLPKGGLVGIGLRHEYPAKYIKQGSEDTDTLLHAENLSHVLKGVDKEIHALIVKTGLDWEFNGIYDEDRDNRGDYSDHGLDGYSETLRSEPGSGPVSCFPGDCRADCPTNLVTVGRYSASSRLFPVSKRSSFLHRQREIIRGKVHSRRPLAVHSRGVSHQESLQFICRQ